MRKLAQPDLGWEVLTQPAGEVLTAEARSPGLHLGLLGVPQGFAPDDAEGWLYDVAAVTHESTGSRPAARPIPALLDHALTGLLFSHAELWDQPGSPVPCSFAFVEARGEVGFGWVGEARVSVWVDGQPHQPAWVTLRDERGREARGWSVPDRHDVQVRLSWCRSAAEPAAGGAEVEAAWGAESVAGTVAVRGSVPAPEVRVEGPPAADAPVLSPYGPGSVPEAPVPDAGERGEGLAVASDTEAAAVEASAPAVFVERRRRGFFAWLRRGIGWIGRGGRESLEEQEEAIWGSGVPSVAGPEPVPAVAGSAPSPTAAVGTEADAPGVDAPPEATETLIPPTPEPVESPAVVAADETPQPEAPAAPDLFTEIPPSPEPEVVSARAIGVAPPADPREIELDPARRAASALDLPVDEPGFEEAGLRLLDLLPVAPFEGAAAADPSDGSAVAPPAAPPATGETVPPPASESGRPVPPPVERAAAPPSRMPAWPPEEEVAPTLDELAAITGHAPPAPTSAAGPPEHGGEPSPAGEPWPFVDDAPPEPGAGSTPAEPPWPFVDEAPPSPASGAAPPEIGAGSTPAEPPWPFVDEAPPAPASGEAPSPPLAMEEASAAAEPLPALPPGAGSPAAADVVEAAAPSAAPAAAIAPAAPAAEGERAAAPPQRPAWPTPQELAPRRFAGRRHGLWIALVGVLFAVGWLAGAAQDDGRPHEAGRRGPLGRALQAVGLAGPSFVVQVNSRPPGAWISVDGEPLTLRTPAAIEVPPGEHTIGLSFSEYGDATYPVRGRQGDRVPLDAALWGALEVFSPSQVGVVDVTVDGVPRGTAPLRVDSLSPGVHEVRFSGDGMVPWGQTVEIRVGETRELVTQSVSSPASGVLQVEATLTDESGTQPLKGAQVWVDGALRGVTPLTLDLPRGPHSVRLVHRGQEAPIQVIDLPGGNQRFAVFELGLDAEVPRIAVDVPARIPRDRPAVLSAALLGIAAPEVREMWLHVQLGEGPWRRYALTLLKTASGAAGVVTFPVAAFDADGRTRWYVSALSGQGDETFTEIRTIQLEPPAGR